MLNSICTIVVLIMAIVATTNETETGQYTIVGPKQCRSNSAYHVSVSVHNATEPARIRLSLENGGDFRLSEEVTVQPWSTESVHFALGVLPPPPSGVNYKLVAEGLGEGPWKFRNETELRVIAKQYSILAQSDKALYKPSDRVQFRALIIDSDTRPVVLHEKLNVHVLDGAGNRVQQWSNVSTENGVFSAKFLLSDEPVKGQWAIIFDAEGETHTHGFEVAEYVLPTFETFIETASDVLYKTGKIVANIRGKYTYGKPVHGTARVTLRDQSTYGDEEALKSVKTVTVGTKGSVEFDFMEELNLREEGLKSLELHVELEEEFTGRKQNATTSVYVRRNRFNIQRTSYSYHYTEGEAFETNLQVTRYDGTPVQNETIEVWYSSDIGSTEETHSEKFQLDNEGNAKVSLNFPIGKNGFFVMAKYSDMKEGLGYFPVNYPTHQKHTVPDFHISETSSGVAVGGTVKLELQSRLPLKHYTYQLIARGDILITKTVQLEDTTSNKYDIEFDATFAMLPSVKFLAYTIREDGTIDVVSTYVYPQASLTNQITLEPAVNETAPGTDVSLKITTPKDSFVGLLAIDKSVKLLRSGNDLSANDVTNSLNGYDDFYGRLAFGDKFEKTTSPFRWSQYISQFDNLGVFVLSNVKQLIPEYYEEGEFQTRPGQRHRYHSFPAPQAPQLSFNKIAAGSSAGHGASAVPTIRKEFPETWIWDTVNIDSEDGVQYLQKKVPDTITSWVISAFSLNPHTGLGLTKESSKVNVIKPFFVSITLPYSVKRGEVVSIPIVVFNYLDTSLNANVTLHNEDKEFEFVEIGNEIGDVSESRSTDLPIKSQDSASITYLIKPLKVGQLTIKVTAVSAMAGDGVQHILPVTPEGVPQYGNLAVFVDLREKNEKENNLQFEVPADAVPDSTRVEVSVLGDIMGSTIKNLDSLIQLPSGCGEQNMLRFVPNVVVLNYLTSIKQLTKEVATKSRQYMDLGYQRQLTYRHSNGSFSAFGKNDASGSTWLTAFAARSFRQAAKHSDIIEERIIREALEFLRTVQSENGSFVEVGTVIHRQMQSGSGQGIALTAYVLLAFLENKHEFPEYEPVIAQATEYLAKNLDALDDVYPLAVVAYALQLADHPSKASVLRNLDAKVIVDGDRKHWATQKSLDKKATRPSSVDTEITSYALLAHFHAGSADQYVPILKYLLSQRNANGGFSSTQDTIMGLQALATVAAQLGSPEGEVKYALTYGEDARTKEFTVNAGNALVLQQFQLPGDVREVNVKATGTRFSLLSLSYKYYVTEISKDPKFKLQAEVFEGLPANLLRLNISTNFIPTAETKVSNMAVVEVEFPSGFTFDTDSLETLKASKGVKKVELKNGDTLVVLYFDNLGEDTVSQNISAVRTSQVALQKPAAVSVYDYYDNTQKSRVFYNAAETPLCDVCAPVCPATCNP